MSSNVINYNMTASLAEAPTLALYFDSGRAAGGGSGSRAGASGGRAMKRIRSEITVASQAQVEGPAPKIPSC